MPEGTRRAGRKLSGWPRWGVPRQRSASLLSPVAPEPSGLRDARHRPLPVVIELKRLAAAHDGKGVEQELVHARPQRLHLRQRPVGPLDETIVVRTDARVVLQARDRRQVEDLGEPGARPRRLIRCSRPTVWPVSRREGFVPASLMS